MNLGMNKIVRVGVVVAVLIVGVVFFVFFRLYQRDVQALTDFVAAYQKYDQAVSDFSKQVLAGAPALGDLEGEADHALVELTAAASAKISSMIKNEKALMRSILEIAVLSGKEAAALKTYQSATASKNGDLNTLAKAFGDLTNQRRAAYIHFRELSELRDK